MAAWRREEEKASENRQREEERGERGGQDKIEVAPGITIESFRRFRATLTGTTQGLPKRR